MPDYSQQIEALRNALASGVRRVQFKDRSQEFNSVDDIVKAIDHLERKQAPRKRAGFAGFSRGDRS